MEQIRRTILFVLAIFVFSLASAGELINNALDSKVQLEVEIAEDSDETETLPQTPSISIDIFNSVIHVSHLIFHSNLIFEFSLPEIKETKAHSVFDSALNFTKYYRTLFRLIMSPNGP